MTRKVFAMVALAVACAGRANATSAADWKLNGLSDINVSIWSGGELNSSLEHELLLDSIRVLAREKLIWNSSAESDLRLSIERVGVERAGIFVIRMKLTLEEPAVLGRGPNVRKIDGGITTWSYESLVADLPGDRSRVLMNEALDMVQYFAAEVALARANATRPSK